MAIPVYESDCVDCDLVESPDDIVALEALIIYQTVFARERNDISGDLSFRVAVPERNRNGTLTIRKKSAWRSGWVGEVVRQTRGRQRGRRRIL